MDMNRIEKKEKRTYGCNELVNLSMAAPFIAFISIFFSPIFLYCTDIHFLLPFLLASFLCLLCFSAFLLINPTISIPANFDHIVTASLCTSPSPLTSLSFSLLLTLFLSLPFSHSLPLIHTLSLTPSLCVSCCLSICHSL